ncbi:MAG TPA: DoxX family protein [Micromonosporaceae bacterium]|nr:DoxX family protein [Micromonosporaceae bacterium]
MNVALWVIAGFLAAAFLGTGILKATQPKEKLAANERMGWTENFSAGTIRTIGILEIAAAAGLILPGLTGIAPILVPLAATGLVLVMIGAAITHGRRRELQGVVTAMILLVLAAVVAWGRLGPYAFS